jgi:hypothetical protein
MSLTVLATAKPVTSAAKAQYPKLLEFLMEACSPEAMDYEGGVKKFEDEAAAMLDRMAQQNEGDFIFLDKMLSSIPKPQWDLVSPEFLEDAGLALRKVLKQAEKI